MKTSPTVHPKPRTPSIVHAKMAENPLKLHEDQILTRYPANPPSLTTVPQVFELEVQFGKEYEKEFSMHGITVSNVRVKSWHIILCSGKGLYTDCMTLSSSQCLQL